MRIMTSGTSYVPIIRITLTVKDSIRLKPYVVDFHALQQREFIISSVTRRTKLLGLFVSTKSSWIEHRFISRFARFHCGDMRSAWSMTTLTANAVSKFLKLKLLPSRRSIRMTTETTNDFILRQQTSERLLQ